MEGPHQKISEGPQQQSSPSDQSVTLEDIIREQGQTLKLQGETMKVQSEALIQLQRTVVELGSHQQSQNKDDSLPKDDPIPGADNVNTSGKRSSTPINNGKSKKSKIVEDAEDDDEESSPFSAEILAEEIPPRDKWPTFELYRGSSDPKEHLTSFLDAVEFHRLSGGIKARLFVTTLKESARRWFTSLPESSILSFKQLKAMFLVNYSCITKKSKKAITLLQVRQGEKESLREYITRFNAASREVTEVTPEFFRQALTSGLLHAGLRSSLSKMSAGSMPEILGRIQKYLDSDDELSAAASFGVHQSSYFASSSEPVPRYTPPNNQNKRPREVYLTNRPPPIRSTTLPPLSASLSFIVAAIKGQPFYKSPPKMTSPYQLNDSSKYCSYHQQKGHETENCFKLQKYISQLINEGHLNQFLIKENDKEKQ